MACLFLKTNSLSQDSGAESRDKVLLTCFFWWGTTMSGAGGRVIRTPGLLVCYSQGRASGLQAGMGQKVSPASCCSHSGFSLGNRQLGTR